VQLNEERGTPPAATLRICAGRFEQFLSCSSSPARDIVTQILNFGNTRSDRRSSDRRNQRGNYRWLREKLA